MLTEMFLVLSCHSSSGEKIGKAGQVQPETTPPISCSPGVLGKCPRVLSAPKVVEKESNLEFICPKGGREGLRGGRNRTHGGATDVSEEESGVMQMTRDVNTSDGSSFANEGQRIGKGQPFLTL